MGHIPDRYKWNVDASTMIVESTGKGSILYRIVSCKKADNWEDALLKNPLTTIRHQQGLYMGLKWMHRSNGIGDFGCMVLIVAVPGMPEGRFYYAKVQGLCFGEDSTKYGYVYFAQTRCMKGLPGSDKAITDEQNRPCNPWSHYFKNPFRDEIKRYADAYGEINPATGLVYESVCVIDGENCVNRELLDPEVFRCLDDARIQILKGRPSASEYDNSNDSSDNFRDKNAGLRKVTTECTDTSNLLLDRNLTEAFRQMRLAYPCVTMTKEHERKVIKGGENFVYVCGGHYVTKQKGLVGFQRTFQVRKPGKELLRAIFTRENSTVDAFRILTKLCTEPFTDDEQETIWTHCNEMVQIHNSEGRVTNAVMDRLGICKLPEGEHQDRDGLCLTQQGPVDLTHAETRAREEVYARRVVTAATEAKMKRAQDVISKHDQKEAATAAAKVEKSRVDSLTPEQKRGDPACMEKAEKAKRARVKKTEKEKKEKDDLANALEVVGGGG